MPFLGRTLDWGPTKTDRVESEKPYWQASPCSLIGNPRPPHILASLASPLAKTHPLDKLDYGTTDIDLIEFALHRV